jgi:UDP-N-acetylglucosamine 4-epimerase
MQKYILLTGGAGFIGSHIAEALLLKNHKVRILDNLSTGNKKNVDRLLPNPNLEFVYGDISNLETVRKACSGIDMICHQAAVGSVPKSIDDPLTSHISNVNGFLNILLGAKENSIKRIVYASSSSVYGNSEKLPKRENEIGTPLSPYAITKYIDELYANVFTKLYGMECIGLRYFNIFGPRQDPNGNYAAVIPKFISTIKEGKQPVINGDGSFSRDFTYVDNAVFANCLALFTNNEDCYGEVFNIGAGSRISILEMYESIADKMKSDIKPILGQERVGDIPHSNADINKAIKLLDYNPRVQFDEGIVKTVDFFMNN